MEFLLIVFLTVLNGVFAMSELALAASRKARLAAMAEAGDKGAQAALVLLGQPNQFLSTVQVGITSIGVLNGIVGEAAFSDGLALWIQAWGVRQEPQPRFRLPLSWSPPSPSPPSFLASWCPSASANCTRKLWPAGWRVPCFGLPLRPNLLSKLLSGTTAYTLRLLRIDVNASRPVTEEEISASLEEGVDAGVIEEHEHQMVQNVFRLDERPLTSLMTPRTDVAWLDADCSVRRQPGAGPRAGRNGGHSWYPVCRGSLDEVLGVISVARLLDLRDQPEAPMSPHISAAVFVPETLSGMELLEQFRKQASRLVFVVDEYGVVQGLLTPRDLLEAITGELPQTTAAAAWMPGPLNGRMGLGCSTA
jgi:putative hemolysin